MTFRDLILISIDNLWRMKLRTFLTTSGVVIAIAAFVSMLSFGAGMQENIANRFESLGLFNTIIVYPQDEKSESGSDTGSHNQEPDEIDNQGDDQNISAATNSYAILDNAAVEKLADIPGVVLAYPFDDFEVTITLGDSSIVSSAQALPVAASKTKLFSELSAGEMFTGDSAHEVVVGEDILEQFGVSEPDSVIGNKLIITTYHSSLDSGLAYVIGGIHDLIRRRTGKVFADSILNSGYWKRVLQEEAGLALGQFFNGYFTARSAVSDSLIITGLKPGRRNRRTHTEPVLVPVATAARLTSAGFSGNSTQLFELLRKGKPLNLASLFTDSSNENLREYRKVTLDLEPGSAYELIKDSVKALGFEPFSFSDEFKEIRDFFLYFNMALSLIGLIALITASLGIINTMVMSIMERRREIGLLKSLGADQRNIRILFLVESAVIGITGAGIGVIFGWIISRLASLAAKMFMASKGVDEVELFSLPLWLIGTALAFGLIVSILAGYYPAVRAGNVDPVIALRNE